MSKIVKRKEVARGRGRGPAQFLINCSNANMSGQVLFTVFKAANDTALEVL